LRHWKNSLQQKFLWLLSLQYRTVSRKFLVMLYSLENIRISFFQQKIFSRQALIRQNLDLVEKNRYTVQEFILWISDGPLKNPVLRSYPIFHTQCIYSVRDFSTGIKSTVRTEIWNMSPRLSSFFGALPTVALALRPLIMWGKSFRLLRLKEEFSACLVGFPSCKVRSCRPARFTYTLLDSSTNLSRYYDWGETIIKLRRKYRSQCPSYLPLLSINWMKN